VRDRARNNPLTSVLLERGGPILSWPAARAISGLLVVRDRFFLVGGFLNHHVVKFIGVKDFATFQAFDIFSVVVPGNNSYPRVFAGGNHRSFLSSKVLFPPIVAAFSSFSSAKLRNRFIVGTSLGIVSGAFQWPER
jgi:hypothetical protein